MKSNKIKLLIAYVVKSNYQGVVNYLRQYQLPRFHDIHEAVLYTFSQSDGNEAIASFLELHPDKEVILELYGQQEKVEETPKVQPDKKETFCVSFSMKECLFGLIVFFLLMLFVTSKRS